MKHTVEILTVTPEMAKVWLDTRATNRNISEKHVDDLAYYMTSGSWQFNGEPILLNGDNTLLDGQHRLSALIKAGVTLQFVVIKGIESGAFKTIDTGRKRNLADVLHIKGEKYTASLASAAKTLVSWDRTKTVNQYVQNHSVQRTSNQDAINIIEKYPEVRKACKDLHYSLLQKSLAIPFWVIFGTYDPEKRDEFFTVLDYGYSDDPQNPAMVLRQRLIDNLKQSLQLRLPRKVIMAYLIKAWNAFVLGQPLERLKYVSSHPFPQPINPQDL